MTPAARHAAAIEILDRHLAGEAAEKTLINWARANRFAGSGDRHAIRDLVYEAIRCRASFAHLGGALTGRGLMIGRLRSAGLDPSEIFTGDRYAPAPLNEAENTAPLAVEGCKALDCPEWLWAHFQQSLGGDAEAVLRALRHRAPVFLRVNRLKSDCPAAISALAEDGIEARPHHLCPTALEVTGNPRRVMNSRAFLDGLVELQDAASQAVVEALPLADGDRVLDYCAGGGGKTLAMVARTRLDLFAHDVSSVRLSDLPARAARAGAQVTLLAQGELADAGPFDLVLADAPCSGSGSWRRAPEAKWRLTAVRLAELTALQSQVLSSAARLVRSGGYLAYATCSLLHEENGQRIETFLADNPGWQCRDHRLLTPLDGGDGFFYAILTRN
ncbi:MAG: RsmB/NOP family class I SAM-dependent RNA methyltransferase [Pseudorhodobacter sp.]